MKIKVCGMKFPDNAGAVAGLHPDYLGFIFYPKSGRFAGEVLSEDMLRNTEGMTRIGVFVNESTDNMEKICRRNDISWVQLHGEETPEQCSGMKNKGFTVVKVFQVGEGFDFAVTLPYRAVADYYLFDTGSAQYGGTGKKFNWDILKEYDNSKEIFLSGGIGPEDVAEIGKLKGLKIHAVDINSRFELEPGRKNVELIKPFIEEIKKFGI